MPEVPAGWTAEQVRSDWWVLHTLTHTCGWTTDPLGLGSTYAEVVTEFHRCDPWNCDTQWQAKRGEEPW